MRYLSARRAARRRERRDRVARKVSAALILVALAAGFAWGKMRARALAEPVSVAMPDPTRRAAALHLLEGAVSARHQQRPTDAGHLAGEARQADRTTPGLDVFVAELALENEQMDALHAAALAASRQEHFKADGKLLLALHQWKLHGGEQAEFSAGTPTDLLVEAGEDQLSHGTARFFAGELKRVQGRPAEAHRSLLGSLYRQQPWHSAAILAAKRALSSDEAGPDAAGSAPPVGYDDEFERFGLASAELGRAQRTNAESKAAASALQATFTRSHLAVLARDPALVFAAEPGQERTVIPYGEILPPPPQSEVDHLMPRGQKSEYIEFSENQPTKGVLGNQ